MVNIIDWILDLFRHEDAARAFVAAPEQTMRDAGFGAVNPAQLSAVAATAVPGMMLGGGDPVVGLQRAVSNHYGFAPSQEFAHTNQWAPTAQWAPSFAPETNTDLASHNQTDLASHNSIPVLSPDQNAGANSQQGGFNLGFGDFVFGGNKTTAGDGAVVVDGHVQGSIVSGDGAVLGNGNDVNNGDVWAGTGANVGIGGEIEDSGTTNVGSGSVIADNDGPVFADVDASGGNGGGASGGSSLIGLGSGDSQGGNAGGGGIIVVSKDTSVGGDSDNTEVDTHVSTVTTTTTTVADNSDHSTYEDNSTFDASHTAVFDNSSDTSLVGSTLDNSHDLALASGNSLASGNELF